MPTPTRPALARWVDEIANARIHGTIHRQPGEDRRTGCARTVSVVSPAGYRIDGLSLEEAATLLRRLG